MQQTPPAVAVVVPAKDEAERITGTVEAARTLTGVDLVVVVDDGSTDDTAGMARAAGATVVAHRRNRGKAAAMTTGAAEVVRATRSEAADATGAVPHALLFVDADLEASAANLGVLIPPVLTGAADMTIAILPAQQQAGGGRGFVVRLARRGVTALTGWTPTQPLSGMRCLSRGAFEAAQPLARGWGVEVGLTVDVLTQGLRVTEVPCELHHRVTGTDLWAQLHRARQYRDVWLALTVRRIRARRSARGPRARRSRSPRFRSR